MRLSIKKGVKEKDIMKNSTSLRFHSRCFQHKAAFPIKFCPLSIAVEALQTENLSRRSLILTQFQTEKKNIKRNLFKSYL